MSGEKLLALAEEALKAWEAGMDNVARLLVRFMCKYGGTKRAAGVMRFVGFRLDESLRLCL